MEQPQTDIDFLWLKEIAKKTNSLQLNNRQGMEEDALNQLEQDINAQLPDQYKQFLKCFNGIEDFDSVQFLSDTEIREEIEDQSITYHAPTRLIPFAKYKFNSAYFVFDEQGRVYVCDHDDENLCLKYPDFLAFILSYSLYYVQNFGVYENIGLSDAEIDNALSHFENLLTEKISRREDWEGSNEII